MSDNVLIHYLNEIEYSNTQSNTIGATTSTTLRTVDSNNDSNTKYVKKFGQAYEVTSVTDAVIGTPRSDGGGTNQWVWEFRGADTNTLFGFVTDSSGSSTFTSGSSVGTAEQLIIRLVWTSGTTAAIVEGDTITIDTNVDASGHDWVVTAETITASGSIDLYAANSGSTYYDSGLTVGGTRLTATGTQRNPYLEIQPAYDDSDIGVTHDYVVVMDSEIYPTEEFNLDHADTKILAALGQTPTILSDVGQSKHRFPRDEDRDVFVPNNSNSAFFNNSGSNLSGDGTWQAPYADFSNAKSAGKTHVVYGGSGAGETESYSAASTMDGTSTGDFTFQPDVGIDLTISVQASSTTVYSSGWTNGNNGNYINNVRVNGDLVNNGIEYGRWGAVYFVEIYDCTNGMISTPLGTIRSTNLRSSVIRNCVNGIEADISELSLSSCVIYGCTSAAVKCVNNSGSNARGAALQNCLLYGNYDGVNVTLNSPSNNDGVTVDYCTILNNTRYGIYVDDNVPITPTAKNNNICRGSGTFDLFYSTSGTAGSFTDYYETNSGFVVSSASTSDPVLCSELNSNFYPGISSESPIGNDPSSEVGYRVRGLEVAANNIEINGFIFDGRNYVVTSIYQDSTRTGFTMKWCTIKNNIGTSVKIYSTSSTSCEISNNKIYDCGEGVLLAHGGNSINRNLIYSCARNAIFINEDGNDLQNNTLALSYGGVYSGVNATSATMKNSIISANSNWAINSQNVFIVTYSCVDGAITSNVDITSNTNTTDSPLFINTNDGSENFDIKTVERGFSFNSPCKNAGDDGNDMGVFIIDRSETSNSWRAYQLEYNPRTLDVSNRAKGQVEFETGAGSLLLYSKGHKRFIPMRWRNDDFVGGRFEKNSGEMRKKLEYISTLIPTRENGLSRAKSLMRVHLLPQSMVDSGSSATVNSSEKSITDSSKSWTENELKGFWITLKYDSGTNNGSISGTTLTVSPSPSWTNDEWIGYFIYNNNHYYLITDNDANTLTLADPDSTLTNQTNIDWSINKYFRVISNTETVLNLSDDNSELVDGSYDYDVDFILCRLADSSFNYSQENFDFQKEWDKNGFRIQFEEA